MKLGTTEDVGLTVMFSWRIAPTIFSRGLVISALKLRGEKKWALLKRASSTGAIS
jgi:hypothetical protein